MMVQMVASNSVLPRWKSYTQSNSLSRYYVLEKNTNSHRPLPKQRRWGFLFLSIENIGVRRERKPTYYAHF